MVSLNMSPLNEQLKSEPPRTDYLLLVFWPHIKPLATSIEPAIFTHL